jgi:hypothetical protein
MKYPMDRDSLFGIVLTLSLIGLPIAGAVYTLIAGQP